MKVQKDNGKGVLLRSRENTRQVSCGGVKIGGGAPIPVQSMTNTFTEDVAATTAQIQALAAAGAEIVRCAVPTQEAAKALTDIRGRLEACGVPVPIVADIHFDYKLALAAIKAGADKIRVNPGNIGGAERLKAVADAAGAAGIPIRIGVNGGSIEQELKDLYSKRPAEALAESALKNIDIMRGFGFKDIVISIKSSDVIVNTEAHTLLSKQTDLPQHIGVTEAGIGVAAVVKSAIGIGSLLSLGIGDTMRVSITGDPVAEIAAARDILRAVNLLPGQITLISCPTCGRCRVDLAAICAEAAEALNELELLRVSGRPIVAALMGCAVNGPGEASHADVGVACGADGGVYFEKGVQVGSVGFDDIVTTLVQGVKRYLDD
ncbi:MAG: flavodoxin-dependent (E)-4-hydroxy-3-methylbut-2-enyl-diphosphate synthase [Defluviitaleaceae bacterium]|nr:flavodoxin-dependent (E)-4-hydroxy-3-methylbut-2-enyl-diphosphate synthase [Defluviitaleaceae bacterium]